MTSHYLIDSWELDNALNNLHGAVETMKAINPPRLHGDAKWIWDDVCDLIELLGKVTTFVPDEKIDAAQLVLRSLANRRPVLQAAE
jgi:hypothetical protein